MKPLCASLQLVLEMASPVKDSLSSSNVVYSQAFEKLLEVCRGCAIREDFVHGDLCARVAASIT